MAKEKKETAEQKLLKIIESNKDEPKEGEQPSSEASPPPAQTPSPQSSPVAERVAASVKGGGISELGLPAVLDPLLGIFKRLGISPKAFGLKEANKIIAVVAVAMCIVFVLTLRGGMMSAKKGVTVDIDVDEVAGTTAASVIPQYMQIAAYLDSVKRRNIFQPFEKKEADEQPPQPQEEKQISAIIKGLKLVGISWFETPETAAVMIEDTVSGMTYFLQQGETIRNVTVKTIYADRVIFTYKGEETDMKL